MTNNLRFYRELRKYSQIDIASFVGVSRNTISSIENGKSLPSLRLAFLLARALYVPVHLLFDFSDEMKIYNEVISLPCDNCLGNCKDCIFDKQSFEKAFDNFLEKFK